MMAAQAHAMMILIIISISIIKNGVGETYRAPTRARARKWPNENCDERAIHGPPGAQDEVEEQS
eukprot:9809941-Karenia_brevis.AAC.1